MAKLLLIAVVLFLLFSIGCEPERDAVPMPAIDLSEPSISIPDFDTLSNADSPSTQPLAEEIQIVSDPSTCRPCAKLHDDGFEARLSEEFGCVVTVVIPSENWRVENAMPYADVRTLDGELITVHELYDPTLPDREQRYTFCRAAVARAIIKHLEGTEE